VISTPEGKAEDSTNCCPTRILDKPKYPVTSVIFDNVVESVAASNLTLIYELLPLPMGLEKS
jgi:hypothetical protein